MHSALAGFVEPGESLEQCLRREVHEEVGVETANLRYFSSQPWPFPHSLMIAFNCDYAGGEIVPEPGEIEAAAWFDLDHLPVLPNRISIARRLIDATIVQIRSEKAVTG
jgi:NAD+ diphosphatase